MLELLSDKCCLFLKSLQLGSVCSNASLLNPAIAQWRVVPAG